MLHRQDGLRLVCQSNETHVDALARGNVAIASKHGCRNDEGGKQRHTAAFQELTARLNPELGVLVAYFP